MSTNVGMLKVTEAAVVSRVTPREINRLFEEDIVPASLISADEARLVHPWACALAAFYFHSAVSLTSEERHRTIKKVAESKRWKLRIHSAPTLESEERYWRYTIKKFTEPVGARRVHRTRPFIVHHDHFLTINLEPYFTSVGERLRELIEARALVVADPKTMGGAPVIKGTRIPVHDVAALAEVGTSLEEMLETYPRLNAEKIKLARIYADAYPPRGRPRTSGDLPKNAVVTKDYKVPRARKSG